MDETGLLEEKLVGKDTNRLRIEPWRASLETDLIEFCYRMDLLPYRHGRHIRNAVGYTMRRLYDKRKAATIRELLYLSKGEYLKHNPHRIKSGDRLAEDRSVWKVTNKLLKEHGFKMYRSGAVASYAIHEQTHYVPSS